MAWQRERYSQAVRKVRTVQEAAPATSNPCSRLPEQEAVRQVDELLLKFGITKIRAKFDAFLWRHQMKSPKKGVYPEEKGTQKLSTKDPVATVKAFLEAYERPCNSFICTQSCILHS